MIKEQIEIDKNSIQELLLQAFLKAKELGIKVCIPRQGYIQLNPVDFSYEHPKDYLFYDNGSKQTN